MNRSAKLFGNSNLEEDKQYRELLSEPHRQAVVPIGAPSAVWHLTLVLKNSEEYKSNYDDQRDEIVNAAKKIAQSIVNTARTENGTSEEFFPTKNNTINKSETLVCVFGESYLRISIDISGDHLNIAVVIDLSKRRTNAVNWGGQTRYIFNEPKFLEFDYIIRKISLLKNIMQSELEPENDNEINIAKESAGYLLNDLWENITTKLLDKEGIFNYLTVLSDTRGLILLHEHEDEDDLIKKRPSLKYITEPTGFFSKLSDAQICASRAFNILKYRQHNHHPPRDGSIRKKIAEPSNSQHLSNIEMTCCTMLRGRAVFLSSFGTPIGYGVREENQDNLRPHVPVEYILFVSDLHRWQIGRLVQRVNILSSMSKIAIRDIREFRKIGMSLRSLGADLGKIELDIKELGHIPHKKKDPVKSNEKSSKALNKINQNLVTALSEITYLNKGVAGGISYRTTRSRSIVNNMKRLMDDLAIERIEGWQPYDEFVRRRLFPVYEYIDRIGERYLRLRGRYDSIASQLGSLTTRNLTSSIENTATKIKTLQETLNKFQKEIHKNHHFVAFVEFAAVVYYMGGVFHKATKPLFENCFTQKEHFESLVYAAFFVIFILFRKYPKAFTKYLTFFKPKTAG